MPFISLDYFVPFMSNSSFHVMQKFHLYAHIHDAYFIYAICNTDTSPHNQLRPGKKDPLQREQWFSRVSQPFLAPMLLGLCCAHSIICHVYPKEEEEAS